MADTLQAGQTDSKDRKVHAVHAGLELNGPTLGSHLDPRYPMHPCVSIMSPFHRHSYGGGKAIFLAYKKGVPQSRSLRRQNAMDTNVAPATCYDADRSIHSMQAA